MRIAALVLGCVGGGLFLIVGLPLTIAHPYGLAFLLAGGFGLAGGIASRNNRTRGGVLLAVATVFALLSLLLAIAGGPAATFLAMMPFVLVLLAMIFAFVSPATIQRDPYRYQ